MSISQKIWVRMLHLFALKFAILICLDLPLMAQEPVQEEQPDIVRADEDLEARAKKITDEFRSKGMVELTDKMGSRVRGLMGVIDGEVARGNESIGVFRSEQSFRAILFASSSMPLKLLRAYASQLEKANGVIVFRGMPGGLSQMKPMISLTHKMILREPDCKGQNCEVFNVGVMVDPLMFEANGVDRVPALTIVEHDPFMAYCERPQEATEGATGQFVTFGDAHLTGHLEALVSLGEARARSLLRAFLADEKSQ